MSMVGPTIDTTQTIVTMCSIYGPAYYFLFINVGWLGSVHKFVIGTVDPD